MGVTGTQDMGWWKLGRRCDRTGAADLLDLVGSVRPISASIMDPERLRRMTEEREPTSWVRALPFALFGVLATPFVMAFTGMPEGGLTEVLSFAIVVAVIGAATGYVAGTVHSASQTVSDLLWLWAGFLVGIAVKIIYDGMSDSLSFEQAAGGISLALFMLGGLGLAVGGLPALLMRRAGLAMESRRRKANQ